MEGLRRLCSTVDAQTNLESDAQLHSSIASDSGHRLASAGFAGNMGSHSAMDSACGAQTPSGQQ